MENNEILKQVNEIFREELDNEEIVLTPESVADDVEEWNSLSHVFLMVAVEKRFKIRFTSAQIQSFNNVGELIQCIKEKLN